MTLRISDLRRKISLGHYELTAHAKDEMEQDGFTIRDVKSAVYSGIIAKRQRHGHGRRKYVVRGHGEDRRVLMIVCRLTDSGRLRMITIFAERK